MLDPKTLDNIARKLTASLPPGLDRVREDLHNNLRAGLGAAISRLDLVEREEFEIQAAVLARTREKLERLEARVRELEARLAGTADGPASG